MKLVIVTQSVAFTLFKTRRGVTSLKPFRTIALVASTYFSKSEGKTCRSLESSRVPAHDSTNGRQPISRQKIGGTIVHPNVVKREALRTLPRTAHTLGDLPPSRLGRHLRVNLERVVGRYVIGETPKYSRCSKCYHMARSLNPVRLERIVECCVPASLMKRMPALETVAGVAFFNELISKTIRIASLNGTRSLETSVST